MEIGLKIKHLRNQKNMSQGQLGEKLGVSKAQISKYETGKNKPSIDQIAQIAKILGVKMSVLTDSIAIVDNEINNEVLDTDEYAELNPDYLLKENERLHRLLEKYLIDGNKAKDQVIKLQQKIDELKDKYERKIV